MGSLKELKSNNTNVHLVLTSSNLIEIYVYDTLKALCGATLESVYDITNSNTFKGMLELVNIQPNLSDRWLFVMDYSKVKNQLKKVMGIFQSETSVFLIKVDNYKDFKEAKSEISSANVVVNDLYLNSLRLDDTMDLLRGYDISQKVKSFIYYSYNRDPEKVFTLCKEMDNGAVIKDSKDVIKICGESVGNIQKFVFQLLTDDPVTKMYLKRSFKKRVNTVYDLCDTFGSRTSYNYIRATIKDILYIKMLYLEGTIYNQIKGLPDCFDEKKLSRYSFYLKDIKEIVSYSKVVSLYNMLSKMGRWDGVQDGIAFLYKYYLTLINMKTESVGK